MRGRRDAHEELDEFGSRSADKRVVAGIVEAGVARSLVSDILAASEGVDERVSLCLDGSLGNSVLEGAVSGRELAEKEVFKFGSGRGGGRNGR